MKRQSITLRGKSYLIRSIVLTSFLIISMTSIVGAQAISNASPEVEIKYVGSIKEKPVFRVAYNTQTRNFIELWITDEGGQLLFSDKFYQQPYIKNFQVDADAYENFKLILTIVDTNMDTREKKRQSYSVNGKVDAIPGLEVTKL